VPYYIVIRGLTGFTIFFQIINGKIFGKMLLNIKCVFKLLYNFCVKHFSF